MDITNIYTCIIPFLEISPPLKTFTLLLIPSTPGASNTATASANIEYVRVYSAITISIYVDIVYKWVTKIVKDI